MDHELIQEMAWAVVDELVRRENGLVSRPGGWWRLGQLMQLVGKFEPDLEARWDRVCEVGWSGVDLYSALRAYLKELASWGYVELRPCHLATATAIGVEVRLPGDEWKRHPLGWERVR